MDTQEDMEEDAQATLDLAQLMVQDPDPDVAATVDPLMLYTLWTSAVTVVAAATVEDAVVVDAAVALLPNQKCQKDHLRHDEALRPKRRPRRTNAVDVDAEVGVDVDAEVVAAAAAAAAVAVMDAV